MADTRKTVRLGPEEMQLIQKLRVLRRSDIHGIMVVKWEPSALSIVTKTGQIVTYECGKRRTSGNGTI